MADKGNVYFKDGEIVAENGQARVYKMHGKLFLEIGEGHTLWAMEDELIDYMTQLQDIPFGRVLEVGLGLGVVSRYLLTFPSVEHLTTVEVNPDVVAVHDKIKEDDRGLNLNYFDNKHKILNVEGISYAYQTKQQYDFIFIDCYDRIDEETLPLIADMAAACSRLLNRGGKMLGWLDKYTPEPHYSIFEKIFELY